MKTSQRQRKTKTKMNNAKRQGMQSLYPRVEPVGKPTLALYIASAIAWATVIGVLVTALTVSAA